MRPIDSSGEITKSPEARQMQGDCCFMYSKGFCKDFGELQCPGTLCRKCEVECRKTKRSKISGRIYYSYSGLVLSRDFESQDAYDTSQVASKFEQQTFFFSRESPISCRCRILVVHCRNWVIPELVDFPNWQHYLETVSNLLPH